MARCTPEMYFSRTQSTLINTCKNIHDDLPSSDFWRFTIGFQASVLSTWGSKCRQKADRETVRWTLSIWHTCAREVSCQTLTPNYVGIPYQTMVSGYLWGVFNIRGWDSSWFVVQVFKHLFAMGNLFPFSRLLFPQAVTVAPFYLVRGLDRMKFW